ncbi:MAG: hypothetical protein ABF289_01285 [Clostridiales bacterium]
MEINMFGNKYDGDKLKDEMITQLEKKYNKKFYPILLEPRGYQIDYDKLKVYPEGGDEETDFAHISKFNEGKKTKYIDNYFGIHIRPEYESMIEKEVLKVFNEVKVFSRFVADSFSDKLTCENRLEDAIKLDEFLNVWFDIYINHQDIETTFENKVKELVTLFEKCNIKGAYSIAFIKKGKFNDINRKNHKNYVKKYTKKFDDICYKVITGRIPDSSNKTK